jgi:hypothetical protein
MKCFLVDFTPLRFEFIIGTQSFGGNARYRSGSVVGFNSTHLPKIEGTERFQVLPFPDSGSGSRVEAGQYRDSGRYLQCKPAAAVKLPFMPLPVTWLLE